MRQSPEGWVQLPNTRVGTGEFSEHSEVNDCSSSPYVILAIIPGGCHNPPRVGSSYPPLEWVQEDSARTRKLTTARHRLLVCWSAGLLVCWSAGLLACSYARMLDCSYLCASLSLHCLKSYIARARPGKGVTSLGSQGIDQQKTTAPPAPLPAGGQNISGENTPVSLRQALASDQQKTQITCRDGVPHSRGGHRPPAAQRSLPPTRGVSL